MTPQIIPEVRDGARDAVPILIAVLPFAAVFGTLAAEAGLSFGEIMLTCASIYAGASQYAMIDLMGQGVPPWLIVLSVFAINFRHVLYSASLGRHFSAFGFWQKTLAFFTMVDPQFAAGEKRASEGVLRPSYYFAYAGTLYTSWLMANAIGALFGKLLENPAAFGFDFILPLYFTGLVISFRQRASFLPVLVASVVVALMAYFTVGSPWHISLGGLAGLLVAAALSKPAGEVT